MFGILLPAGKIGIGRLLNVFKLDAMSRTKGSEWFGRLKRHGMSLEDHVRSVRFTAFRSDESTEKLEQK